MRKLKSVTRNKEVNEVNKEEVALLRLPVPVAKKKLTEGMPKFLCFSVLCFSMLVLPNCKKDVHVIVDGKKYSEENLKEEIPDYYASIKKRHNDEIIKALETVAEKKLFEIEAKKQKLADVNSYYRQMRGNVVVSEEEVQENYQQLKKAGQIPADKPYQENVLRLRQSLENQRFRQMKNTELSQLKKRYGYSIYKGPVEKTKVNIDGEPSQGSAKAPVVVVEFSGYDCPYCSRVQDTARLLREKYKGKLKWVFKDYPLNPGSIEPHIAASCVFKQNKETFWPFFNMLYKQGRKLLEPALLQTTLTSLGIDVVAHSECTKDPAVGEEILDDHKQGREAGVGGIPHFFINGRSLVGAREYEAFAKIIDEELE